MPLNQNLIRFAASLLLVIGSVNTLPAQVTLDQNGTSDTQFGDNYVIQGFSQPGRIARLSSITAGIVEKFHVSEGDFVKQGSLLVELDRSVHNQKLELARVSRDSAGEFNSAVAELAARRRRLESLTKLAKRKHASQTEKLQAETDVEIGEANLERALDRRAQHLAEYNRLVAESEQLSLRAPFDGVIVEFEKEVGEYVGPADVGVCTIADLSTLSVEFLLPRNFRSHVRLNEKIDVFFTVAGQTTNSRIEYISPFPNGETNTFVVKAIVENPVGRFSAGERCQLQIQGLSGQNISQSTNLSGNQLSLSGQ